MIVRIKKACRARVVLLLLTISCFISVSAGSPPSATRQATYIGIPRGNFEFVAAAQQSSQWCWAASIQMVLNYYGVSIGQPQIVARTYGVSPNGQLPNWAGSFEAITANLSNWSIDNSGVPYVVQTSVGMGAPPPTLLLQELQAQRPVIAAYRSGPNSGHAVVITAASYTPSQYGPIVQTVIVRDPWPSQINVQNRGRVEYPGASIAQVMEAYWIVRVNR
jgi:hypothetical protein